MVGRRKRQTALTFTPLPSSSPAAKAYHKQIQDRAAAVRFTDSVSPSPYKKRRLNNSNGTLPTPKTTSCETAAVSLDSADEILTRRSSKTSPQPSRKRQSRLKQRQIDFTQARDPSTFDPPISLRSSPKPKSTESNMFTSSSSRKRQRVATPSSGESAEEEEVVVTKRARAKAVREPTEIDDDQELDDEDESEDVIPTSSRHRQGSRRAIVLTDDEEGGEEPSSDEEDMPTTTGKRARQTRQTPSSPMLSAVDSDDDDVIEVTEPARPSTRPMNDDSDDDESDLPQTPRRRSLKKHRELTQQEQDELNEDLDFLAPSDDNEAIPGPRSSQSAKRDARQSALARLKAKRAGTTMIEEEEGKEEGEGEEDDEDEALAPESSHGRYVPTSSKQMFSHTEEDEDFIESDDGEAPLGIPEGMPIQFTTYASAKAKDLFRYAVDWFVQKSVNPASSRDDDLYKLSFRKLDDEVKGLAQSKFTSSSWVPDFVVALTARPDIAYQQAPEALQNNCDACNRTSHPATYEVQFHGKPYYSDTLEEVGNPHGDPDDSDDSDDDDPGTHCPSYDAQGREVPAESVVFRLGKFCMANARAAHALHHWRYHLAQLVDVWLTRQGYNSAEQVVARNRMSTKKRRKFGHRIVDEMDRTGQMKEFYRMFKDNIAEARTAKQPRYEANSP